MRKTFSPKNFSWRKAAPFAAGAAFVGLVVVIMVSAAGTPVAFEAESGSVVGAVVASVTGHSGTGVVKFGAIVTPTPSVSPTATATPSLCAQGGTYLWSNLATCGWPDASNTGYVAAQCAGGVLANSTLAKDSLGIIHVTAANTTITCQKIVGCIELQATGVTLRNNFIQGCNGFNIRGSANGTGTVMVDPGATATIDHNEFDGLKQVHACVWYSGATMTATANNCHGVNDGMFSWWDSSMSATSDDNFTIRDNYFHDFTAATANGHIDGYQTEGAGNGLIDHNTFLMTNDSDGADSAVAIWDGQKSSHDITVQNNLIAGGGFAIYAEDYSPSEASPAGGFSVTNTFFTNNKFSTNLESCVGFYGIWYPRGNPSDKWNRSGNRVMETNENVDATNPHSGGALCS